MKVYQLYFDCGFETVPVSRPFESFEDCKTLLCKLAETPADFNRYSITEESIKAGDYYRNGNTLYLKDKVCKGFVKGVYYQGNPERI